MLWKIVSKYWENDDFLPLYQTWMISLSLAKSVNLMIPLLGGIPNLTPLHQEKNALLSGPVD